ncbi:MAG TPA: class I SAM-dependent methyltransferase [Pyrinomonadaceae bacterium]
MAKTERELAFIRDFDITDGWTRRFTDLIDKHVGFKDAENILYINAGTGDHCIAIREKLDKETKMFATCENDELLSIARDKGAATKSDIAFSNDGIEPDSFDAVVADGSFTRPDAIAGLIAEAVSAAGPGGDVAIVLPSSGSFGEIFSLLWEVLFNEDLGEHGHAAETMIEEIPSVSRVEEMAAEAGLRNVKTELTSEIFEFANGAEFVASPLVADFLLPVWLQPLDDDDKERVTKKLSELIDDEDGSLSFRFSVKVTLVTGKKERSH